MCSIDNIIMPSIFKYSPDYSEDSLGNRTLSTSVLLAGLGKCGKKVQNGQNIRQKGEKTRMKVLNIRQIYISLRVATLFISTHITL